MFLRVSIVAALVCFSIFLGRLWVDSGPLRLASSTNNRADELTSTLLIGGSQLGFGIRLRTLQVLHSGLVPWVDCAPGARPPPSPPSASPPLSIHSFSSL